MSEHNDDTIDKAVLLLLEAGVIAPNDPPPEVVVEPPKVVDMFGKPTDKEGNKTHPKIFKLLADLQKEITDEPCVGMVVAFVDGGGRVGSKFFYEAGFGHHAISAATILQHRVVARWEKNLVDGKPVTEG